MEMMNTFVCIIKFFGAILVVLQLDLLLSNYSGAVADATHVGCREKERHALLELKASLVLDDTFFHLGTVRVMVAVHGKELVVTIKLAMLRSFI